VASGIGAGLSRFPSCMNGAFDGRDVYKNLEVGFKEACLAII